MNIEEILSLHKHNVHYLNRYIRFIEYCQLQDFSKYSYKEKHHILPKSMFPTYANLNLNKFNSITMPARHHFICHLLLWKTFNNYSMSLAIHNMKRQNKQHKETYFKVTSKIYENIKASIKFNCNTKNSKFYNNGIEQRMFQTTDVPVGWTLGRLNKPWNKGLNKTDERVLNNSKNSGASKRGKPSWISGKTKETDPRVMNISKKVTLSLTGKKQSKELINKRIASTKITRSKNPEKYKNRIPWNKGLSYSIK